MKNDTLTAILNGVLAFSLVLSVLFCLQFMIASRNIRSLQGQVEFINAYRINMQYLAADCRAYATHHPDIDPLLESIGIKRSKAAPTK